jgi:predicted trehalose synthase
VNEAALENSAASLGEALEALHTAIASTREVMNLPETRDEDGERVALTTLLAAAEKVMVELDEFRTTAS